jgi:hypothetical protein
MLTYYCCSTAHVTLSRIMLVTSTTHTKVRFETDINTEVDTRLHQRRRCYTLCDAHTQSAGLQFLMSTSRASVIVVETAICSTDTGSRHLGFPRHKTRAIATLWHGHIVPTPAVHSRNYLAEKSLRHQHTVLNAPYGKYNREGAHVQLREGMIKFKRMYILARVPEN